MAGPGLGSKNKQGSNGSVLLKGAGTKQPAKRLGGNSQLSLANHIPTIPTSLITEQAIQELKKSIWQYHGVNVELTLKGSKSTKVCYKQEGLHFTPLASYKQSIGYLSSSDIASWLSANNSRFSILAGYAEVMSTDKLMYGIGKGSVGSAMQYGLYKNGWSGNQYVRTFKVLPKLKALGKATFYGGVIIDVYLASIGTQSVAKAAASIGVSVFCFVVGGPVGLTVFAVYTLVDQTIGWEAALNIMNEYKNRERKLGLPTAFY